MFAVIDKFGINRKEKFTELGNKICIVCDGFGAKSELNSDEIALELKWKVSIQALTPYRNIENPTLKDYKYQEIAGVAAGVRAYTNADKRQDLEIVNGVPTPKFEQARDEFGNLLYMPELDENGEVVTIPEVIPAVIVDDMEVEPERTINHILYTIEPVMIPTMIGNIDFWLKFGGAGIVQDLSFTLYQISLNDISSFVKL